MKEKKQFSLTRRFAVWALVSIVLVGTTSAWLLSHFIGRHILHRDGELTMQFLQGLTDVQQMKPFFSGVENAKGSRDAEQFFEHLAALPDTLHANVYDLQRKVLWSTSGHMIGKTLPLNSELSEALSGHLAVESNLIGDKRHYKAEHKYLPGEVPAFVEDYVPIFDMDKKTVIGVVELYRTPKALFETTRSLIQRVWIGTLVGGLFLFLSLFWLAWRADRVIQAQQQQLVESETLAAVGEMATAIAHSIRNPLASIRTSAELAEELEGAGQKGALRDIVSEVDRIAAWIKNLLTYTQPASGSSVSVDVAGVIETSLSGYTRELSKHGVLVKKDWPQDLPRATAEANLLAQAFNSLIANAIEAMPQGGTIALSVQADTLHRMIGISVEDTGQGMTQEQIDKAFVPFHTTKQFGLGVGLPMVQRIFRRFGGMVEIDSTPGCGTTVRLKLPTEPR